MSLLLPTVYQQKITDLTPSFFQAAGISALLLDVDNTLTLPDSPHVPEEVRRWITAMEEDGFALIIVSNNRRRRVAPFAKKLGLPFISSACKPLPFGFLRAIRSLGLPRSAAAVIGDQIWTDILGARLCGLFSVLLDPLKDEKEGFLALKRRHQNRFLAKHRQK